MAEKKPLNNLTRKQGKRTKRELNWTMKDGTPPQTVIVREANDSELWRLEAKVNAEEDSARDELRKAEQLLHNTMDRNIQTGLAAARRIATDLNLSGYYGPLYELFTLTDNRYRTAAEVTAGQSLFHAVVDTDETARKILEVLIKEKAGRITFIPLNIVRVRPVKYPVGEDGQPLNETVPILERITAVDPKFQKALDSV